MKRFREAGTKTARVVVITFDWSSHWFVTLVIGLSLIESHWFVTHRKEPEEVYFVEEEYLHKKIKNKDVYMWIIVWYRKYFPRYM